MELLIIFNNDNESDALITPPYDALLLLIIHLVIEKDDSSLALMTPPLRAALLFVTLVLIILIEDLLI